MAPGAPSLVVFLGGLGDSAVERTVAGARVAAALDSIEAALEAGYAGALIVSDGRYELPVPPAGATVDFDGGPFHFGERLAEVVRRHRLGRVAYLGGGSLPLLGAEDFRAIAGALDAGSLVTNNQYSSDLVAFPAAALDGLALPQRDNRLARELAEATGLPLHVLPRTVASLLDIDGPSDIAVLALTGEGGPRLRRCLEDIELDLDRYRRVLPLLVDRSAQITVAGRVGSHAWPYLESETACRVRLFAEERGMDADDRAAAGEARSLLGYYLEEVGPRRLFDTLAELGDAAIIDTRVLLAHLRVEATREQRFVSDLGRWRELPEGVLRDLTRAAIEARIPVLLGGHSLVSGGLMALNEDAWRQSEGHG